MKYTLISFAAAFVLFGFCMTPFMHSETVGLGYPSPGAQLYVQGPITTGDFPAYAPPTLILLNDSALTDSQLADIANVLGWHPWSGPDTLPVQLATRLKGVGTCAAGEWCLTITDNGNGSDFATGARVGVAIAMEIARRLQKTSSGTWPKPADATAK